MTADKFCTLIVVRHGETEWNQKGIVQGHTDIELSDVGRNQAIARAHSFKEISFSHAISSDLKRARQTAELLIEGRNMSLQTATVLREQSWGPWEGRLFDDLRKQFGAKFNAYTGSAPHHVPGVESHYQVAARVKPYLHELAERYAGAHVLIVTHGGVLKGLIYHLGLVSLYNRGFDNLGFMKLQGDKHKLSFIEASGLIERNN